MKTFLRYAFVILTIFFCSSLWAKEKKSVAVIPFVVHSEENLDYVKQGIWDMLSSRISIPDKIEVLSKDITLQAIKDIETKEITIVDAYDLGKKMNVDYVVFGSMTKIGKSLSIDGKLVDIAVNKPTVNIFSQTQGMDDVISKISDFAQKINQNILGTASLTETPSSTITPPPQPQDKLMQSSRESAIISAMRKNKKGTLTSFINPDFIHATEPVLRKDFIMSQKFPTEFKGMDIGDVNKDGMNEVVIIDNNNVMIYQNKNSEFKLLQKVSGHFGGRYLAVDVADVNKNGICEIIITNLTGTTLESFILEFKDGKYISVATKLPWFLRVVETLSGPVLLGQRRGFDQPFDTPIYQIVWENGQYKQGGKMKIPVGLSVYGLAITPLAKGGSEKIIAIDDYDYLTIYEKTDIPLSKLQTFSGNKDRIWKSDEIYGGSNNYIDSALQYGQSAYNQSQADRADKITYLNPRILTYDSESNGNKGIIIVKNLSTVGRLFRNVRLYSSSELYDLEWDGLGLVENWKTKKINGYVADYHLKDIDNDGQKEIVLALVLSVGATITDTSVIVVYEMNRQQDS